MAVVGQARALFRTRYVCSGTLCSGVKWSWAEGKFWARDKDPDGVLPFTPEARPSPNNQCDTRPWRERERGRGRRRGPNEASMLLTGPIG